MKNHVKHVYIVKNQEKQGGPIEFKIVFVKR